MNDDQRQSFNAALKAKPFLRALVTKLLAMGGDCVVCWDADLVTNGILTSLLLEYGEAREGAGAILQEMDKSHCHANAIQLATNDPTSYQWHIGYALSSDSVWRPHSFLLDRKTGEIVETTVAREKYFSVPIPTRFVRQSDDKPGMNSEARPGRQKRG